MLLLSFVLSGTSMYFLCRDVSGSCLGGDALPPSPLRTVRICSLTAAHPVADDGGAPVLLALHRLVDQPTPRRGVWLGVAMAAQAYARAYYSIFVLLMVGFGVLVLAALRRNWTNHAHWVAVGVGAVVSIVLSLPLAVTAVFLQQSGF